MKKKLYSVILFAGLSLASVNLYADMTTSSDSAMFNEVNIAFKNQFYPGAVEKASLMQSTFPNSVYIQQVLAIKGDALICMGQYDEAVLTLEDAVSHMHTGSQEFAHCLYLLGQAYMGKKDYNQALKNLHKSCTVALADKQMSYYHPAIFLSAKTYYILGQYEKSLPLFEQALANRVSYSKKDYEEILQKYMLSANRCGKAEKSLSVFNQINQNEFDTFVYNSLKLYAADANVLLGKDRQAYDYYCQVVECGNETLAVNALKKAYNLSEKKNIGVNPGDVFSKTVETFADNPELVNEFWIRLGIDEYNSGNFKKAESYFANDKNNSPLVTIYRAKILLDSDSSVAGALKAEEVLSGAGVQEAVEASEVLEIENSYYSVLLQCKIQSGQWEQIPSVYEKIASPSLRDDYVLSAYYYRRGEWDNVLADSGVLYASALARKGDAAAAAQAFGALDEKDALTAEFSAEYAKVLFSLKRFSEAYSQSLKSSDAQKDYLCGLCQVNLRNWNTAKNHFASYIKAMSGKGGFNKLVFYYKGYAEYCLSEFKDSYSSFVRFASEAAAEELRKYKRSAYEYAAKCALQSGDLKNASAQAENMMKTSVGQEELRSSVIFVSDVFTDSGEYERAVSLLAPYTLTKDDFSVEALFRTARIYERQGNAEKADQTYNQVASKYPKSSFAEEALYRPGEIYYSKENYALAFNRFNSYLSSYAAGRFAEAAMYFGGDSAFRLGEINRAVILNKTLVQRYPDSVYAYGALKNLMESYYRQESYQLAIEVARSLVKNYPTQAASDEVGEKLDEMEKIVKGTDRRVAKKQSEYEKLGGLKTPAGRIAGSELVKLYAEDTATQVDAFNLALSLLEKQTDESELAYAAENAEFVADYYRHEQKLSDAAKNYLKAAQFFRSLGDSQKAASSLYSAAEAFAADGYAGDARETAELLKNLYPDTRYAERVGELLK